MDPLLKPLQELERLLAYARPAEAAEVLGRLAGPVERLGVDDLAQAHERLAQLVAAGERATASVAFGRAAGDRPDEVMLAAGGPDPRPISLRPPDLKQIHLAGRMAGHTDAARQLLRGFEAYRDLELDQRRALERIWAEHDVWVGRFESDRLGWATNAEYLDPDQPLLLDTHVAEVLEISSGLRARLVSLHHQIRRSLAAEAVWEVNLHSTRSSPIRYTVTTNGLPARDDTVPLPIDLIDRALGRAESWWGRFDRKTYETYRGMVALIETARRYQKARGWHTIGSDGIWLIRRIFPDIAPAEAEVISLLARLVETFSEGVAGDDAFANLPERAGLGDFVKAVAAGSGLPEYVIIHQLLERQNPNLDNTPPGLDQFPYILRGLELTSVERPDRVLYRLYRDLFDWAFKVRSQNGKLVFLMKAPERLDSLREGGLRWVMTQARVRRRWVMEELTRRVARILGRGIKSHRLSDYAANRRRPGDPAVLRAIVQAFNGHPEAEPVDPAIVLLATEPTLLRILTLRDRETGALIAGPQESLYDLTATPRPIRFGARLGPTRAALDPKGFGWLIWDAMLARGWDYETAAQVLGVDRHHLWKVQTDPARAAYVPSARDDEGRDDGGQFVPGHAMIHIATDPNGFGRPLREVLDAHMYSYWRDDAPVQRLRRRSWQDPVFIDRRMYPRVSGYAEFDFVTPGELLYSWRQGVNPNLTRETFLTPASEEAMARFCGIGPERYRLLETNQAILREDEATLFVSRLGRPDFDKQRLLEASRRLAEEMMGRPLSIRRTPLLRTHPGVEQFLRLAATRLYRDETAMGRLSRELSSIGSRNRPSIQLLARLARAIADPAADAVGDLIDAVHHTENRLRNRPTATIRGPVLAVYYHLQPGSPDFRRFSDLVENPRTVRVIIDPKDGRFEAVMRPLPAAYDPAPGLLEDADVARLTTDRDRARITEFFRRLREEWRGPERRPQGTAAERVRRLAREDPPSFRSLLNTLKTLETSRWDRREARQARYALHHTNHFLETWGSLPRDGSVYAFYHQNFGRRQFLSDFSATIARGNVTRVIFRGGNYRVETRPVERAYGLQGVPYSYRNAARLYYVGRVATGRATEELGQSVAEVAVRISTFFDGVEERLAEATRDGGKGMNAADIRRAWGLLDYPIVRHGKRTISPNRLSDAALAPLRLTDRQKEELRHLEALLMVTRDRESSDGTERGPYDEEVGAPLRYFRFLTQVSLHAVKDAVGETIGFQGYSDVELGRVALEDPALVRRTARAVGVPRAYEDGFVRHITRASRTIRLGLTIPSPTPQATFHGPSWRIPTEAASDTPPLVARAIRFMETHPIPDWSAYFEAGRRIRFARLLVPGGLTMEQAAKELGLDVPPLTWNRWEFGTMAMPPDVLDRWADLLVTRGVLTSAERRSYVATLNRVYDRR